MGFGAEAARKEIDLETTFDKQLQANNLRDWMKHDGLSAPAGVALYFLSKKSLFPGVLKQRWCGSCALPDPESEDRGNDGAYEIQGVADGEAV